MSDQDFFFDEDETAEDTATEKPARKQAASRPQARSTAAAPAAVQSVSVTVASLIGVVALLAGIIIGILIPSSAAAPTATTSNGTGAMTAPQLSEEELNSGALPEGHPDLGSMGAAPATATPDATTPAQ